MGRNESDSSFSESEQEIDNSLRFFNCYGWIRINGILMLEREIEKEYSHQIFHRHVADKLQYTYLTSAELKNILCSNEILTSLLGIIVMASED